MTIDIRTLALVMILANLLQSIALSAQYYWSKNKRGLGWWAAGCAAITLGFAFNFLRDHPTLGHFSIVFNNFLFFCGMAFFYNGTLQFFDKRGNRWLLAGICLAATLITSYFTYFNDNLAARRVNFSSALAILAFLNAQAFKHGRALSIAPQARFLAAIFALYGAFFAVRAVIPLTGMETGTLFSATLTQTATYLATMIAGTLWTLGMIILDDQRANKENLEARENLELIFNTNPDSVLITRLADGLFVLVNDGFTSITGYSREEVLGKSILDVNIWKDPADRQKVIAMLNEKGYCENQEAVFVRKDGSELNGLFSTRIIALQGTAHIVSVTRDITENKRAEEKRREREERHRILFTESPDAYLVISDGKFVDCNRAAETMLRGERSQIIGQTPDALSPEYQPDGENPRRLRLKKSQLLYKTVFLNLNGYTAGWTVQLFVDVSLAPMTVDGNTALVTTWRDITERKQAEDALRESEQNYRTLADSGQAMVWLSDNNRNCYYFNSVWLKFTGLSLEQAQKSGWAETVHPEDAQRSQDAYFRAFESQEIYRTEYRLRRYDGVYRWVLDEGSPRYDSRKNFTGFIGHSLDITDRKLVEQALQTSKNQISQLLENTDQGIYGIDMQGGCTFINQSGLNLLGYQLDECLGKNMHLLVHHSHPDGSPYAVEDCPIYRTSQTGEDARKDCEVFWRKDGSSFPTEYSTHPILEDEKIRGTVITFSDISIRKQAELALQESAEELKQFNEQLEDSIAKANEMAAQAVQAEMMIREREASLNDAQHLARLGNWKYIVATGNITWSNELFQIFGVDRARGALDWKELREFVHPDDLALFDTTLRRALIKNEAYEIEIRARRPDGSQLWLLLIGGKNTAENKRNPEWVSGTIQDITERKHTEEALRETNAFLENLINYANAPIIVCDPQFHITRFNHAFERLTGRSEAEMLEQPLEMLFPPEYSETSMRLFRTTLTGERLDSVEIKIMHRDESVRTILWNSATLFSPDGQTPIATIAQGQDITERKHLEEKMHQQATTDELTGVANRRHLLELAHLEIRRAVRTQRPLAIALIDIDHFKYINDTFGHAAGDQALKAFTRVCQKGIREIDVFARFGGDEFALLLPETNLDQAHLVVERVREAIANLPLTLDGQPASITISSGVAELANDLENFDSLLSRADQALYNAKQAGRNKVVKFKV